MKRTRIKICGLTREADVLAAVDAGADAIGFVFYAKSKRYVTPARAAELARLLPPFVTPVGLFVNATEAELQAALEALPTMLLQFHGDESPQDCERPGRPYMRAARMEPGFDLLDYAQQYSAAQAILLDAHVEGYGGGGKVFDWSLIPKNLGSPVVLSGGLHAGNVLAGITQARPWAVDVSSGVEAQGRGLKCAELMREFCEAVARADAQVAVDLAVSNPEI
ncbi:phosphoribosylanthranilate isomerase [Paucibacter sp. TC2R-5]|uniref:phosphoribosylanthranilate isomerase n=1 Tax=Paucibacter sp. TC2R-5 TaxID=2893555 RepID=UPI0021E42195|nr:phosphoribosylanthranilate isomerase [Paucibacter sp. TC2R-5]MCV2361145.1 phosphoribosylanthranilate isomerase [Paucibacter sp. TC2R-5]